MSATPQGNSTTVPVADRISLQKLVDRMRRSGTRPETIRSFVSECRAVYGVTDPCDVDERQDIPPSGADLHECA